MAPSSHPVLPNRVSKEGLSGEVPLGQDLWEVQKDTCSAAVLMDLATRWRKRGAQTFPLLFFPTAKCGATHSPPAAQTAWTPGACFVVRGDDFMHYCV